MFGVAMETGGKQVLSPESAAASGIYDQFVTAQTFKSVLGTFRLLCDTLRIKPTNFPNFYPKLKVKLRSWKVQALWAKFEKRASHKCYNRGKTCANTKVLIIGAGPCGLRAAIEAQLLGAKVVVIEKRDRFSRNNVLHLWPFIIHDLRNLGAKKFYGKFCAGTIDHISIRQLQCVLLKVALLLGVEVHENVVFEDLIEPPLDQSQEKIGWRALLTPRDHPVSQYEFDVVIGADGKRNTLTAFKRKEFRGKLAIAITANFINKHSEAEARVQEISGVAFIFNQKFFQDLKEYTGIDLENIVYYKDETHYFVMTAKKTSLIEKGVILNDFSETERLLSLENVNREALLEYAREAADFSTNFQMPNLDFAVNHYGQADVAMFDFTSMFAAESACRIVELRGHKLLQCLVGDSLLEPFWPTGSGCARGFLSSMDACWMIRSFSLGTMTPLQVLAERESAYRLLAQTTHENLNKDFDEYSLNPASRYPNLNLNAVRPAQVKNLYTTDRDIKDEPIENYEIPKKRKKKDSFISSDALLNWCQRQVILYKNIRVENMTSSWKNGMVLCSIIHRYRPDLIDFNSLEDANAESNIQTAFDVCEREYGILPVMTAKEMSDAPDALSIVAYVSQIYDVFRGQIPHIARAPLADISPEDRPASPNRKMPTGRLSLLSRIGQRLTQRKRYPVERNEQDKNLEVDVERELAELRRVKKRRSLERDRALFILNKDGKQPVLTGIKKLEPTFEDREEFSSRVKDLEEKLYGAAPRRSPQPVLKKVGKISQSDWNVKMLEEKLKGTKPEVKKDREEVPKWSRDIFEEKLRTMDSKSKNEGDDEPMKYIDFDSNLRMLDKKLKEGNNLETGQRGMNKVSAMAEQISGGKVIRPDSLPLQKSNSNAKVNALNLQQGSESCYFCQKRVYLMERQSANGKFFHRGCFKCECCHIALRLGNYGVGIEDPYIGKFLCLHHFSMRTPPKKRPSPTSEIDNKKVARVVPTKINVSMSTPKANILGIPVGRPSKYTGLTPERVEFENTLDLTSEEELLSEIDEDEWTDRNFGMSANEYESTESESEFSSEEMTDEEREELEKAYNKSFVGKAALSENLKKWFTKSDESKKVGNEEQEDEDTDEEYDESDEEYSYEEYENEDGESTPTEGEPRQGGGEGPSDEVNKAAKTSEGNGEVVSQPLAPVDGVWNKDEYKTLKSNDETGSEELQSNSSESDDYTDESETETDSANGDDELDADEINEDSNRSKIKHEIPSIVIDVTTVNAPNEEDDSYFETLQQQSLEAEKTLENLIRGQCESVAETPCTPTECYAVVEEMHPLVKLSPNQELNQVSVLLNEQKMDELNQNNEELNTPVVEDKSSILEDVDKVRCFRTLPKDLGRNKRPISLIDTVDKFDVTDKKFGSVVDINREKQFPEEDRIINKVDSVSSFGKRKSSLESASSLPDLEKSKPIDKDNIGSGNKLTESPTAKMMLKLKERYLLGSSNEPETKSVVSELPTKIEPVVKSLLDLISEKQKMLSPATSPSPLQQTRSFNYNESSPSPTSLYLSSNSSTPSFSDPSRVALTGFSVWASRQSPVSTTTITSKPLTETSKDSTNGKVDDVVKCDKNEIEVARKESREETLTTSSLHDKENEVIEVPVASAINCDQTEFNSKIQLENTVNDSLVGDSSCARTNSVEDLILAAAPCIIEDSESSNKSNNEFSHINDSNITIRSRRKRSSGETVDDFSNLDIESNLEDVNPESTFLIKLVEADSSEEVASVEPVILVDDFKVEELAVVDNMGNSKEESSIHGDDDIAEMLSNSECSSDSTPSLDESIYHPPAAQPKLMQQQFAAYVGSLASRGITFGGVRDSIDIRKSALKRSPIKMGIGHSLLLNAAKNETGLQFQTSSQPVHIEESIQPAIVPERVEEKNSSKMISDIMSNEEIPFADEESSSQDSEKNIKKKKPLRYTPSTPVKRPTFDRPISMIEMRSFSFPSLAPKNDLSPDTPLSEGHGFSTPSRNREEVIDDLRQLRTVEREKARQLARERARLKSDEELGIKGLDYSKLRRKYQKSDDSPNIREEGNYILEDFSTSEETPCEEGEMIECEDLINHVEMPLSPNLDADIVEDKIGSGLPESSSPDSDVFERCSPIPITEETKSLISNEVLAVEDEPEAFIDQFNPVVVLTPLKSESESSQATEPSKSEELAVKTSESSESAVFECIVDNYDAIGTGTGSSEDQVLSGTSTNSKTDCASYLEPDLSIRDLKSHQFSPDEIPNKIVDKGETDNSVKSKSNSLPGLLSKKDKAKKKSTSPPPSAEKQKSKEKKGGLLSLFSSLSKSKERDERDNKKEKSPSPPLASLSTSQSTTTVATEVPLQGAGIRVDGTPKESRFHKLKLSRSKDKVKDKRKQKSQSVDSPNEISRPTSTVLSPTALATTSQGLSLTPDQMKPKKYILGTGDKTAEITLDKHALLASMAFISKSASTAKVSNGNAPQASEDSFSDVEDENSQTSPGTVIEISEERRRKYEKMMLREQRLQEQKRLRGAQEIQRQLEELDVKQRSLELRGVEIEKALRGEGVGSDENRKEQELLQEWLYLMQTKNNLIRHEHELMVKAKELELEDRHARLKARLYKLMQIEDTKKTDEQLEEEGKLLSEAYEIVNQRDNLIMLLEGAKCLEEEPNLM